ncbi:acyl-CoA thioesterase [Arthrobacter echini]|uniref:Acyl-CoA thioesterase n=1 Tax=Arthrobacter echini TaxID=1529066 RepID=A0A5D0XSI9_9MICC|nr:thioesterase family protein [Arthrobacter echini]TYC99472.1 acyl-CoA thioesterase [Arthrobacter echini]
MSFVRTIPMPLRFGDEDSYGHVNNVRFLQFLEDARVLLMSEPLESGSFMGLVHADHYTLVARQEIEYLAPLNFSVVPAAVDVWVTGVGASSFEMGYTVRDRIAGEGSVTSAIASTSLVLVSRSSGRPVRISADQRAVLESWLGPAVPFRRARARQDA